MIDLNILTNYVVLIVVGICVCIGYILKNSCPKLDNKYIPLIMGLLGLVLNIWLSNWQISGEIVLGGLFSGLASTGLHQAFKNLINGNKKEDE